MSARRLLALGVVALALTGLTGCGGGGDGDALADDLAAAAKTVPGVESADLTYMKGSSGNNFIKGTITTNSASATGGQDTLKGIYAAMGPVLKDAKNMRSYSLFFDVTAADGSALDPTTLGLTNRHPPAFEVVEKFG